MKMKYYAGVALVSFLLGGISAWAEDAKFLYWKFDAPDGSNVVETVSADTDAIEGDFSFQEGVEGLALKLDGFTSVIEHEASKAYKLEGSFTTEAWVALAAYPWNWCPIITQMGENNGGFSFEIGPRGEFGLKMSIAGNIVTRISSTTIPLREWTHLAAVFKEGEGIRLYLNGQPAGVYATDGKADYAPKKQFRIGMNYTAVKPSDQIGDIGNKPYWFSLDGLIDELKVYNRAMPGKALALNYQRNVPVPDSGLERRLMPRGPKSLPDRFAAYYTKLKYYDEWDALWPVADDPDIVVTFEDTPVRLIFWRGTRYSPAWVTDRDQWMCDQSVEAWDEIEGCFEHMQDRHCRYSHVRLLEDSPARKVVHWRYAPVSAFNQLWNENKKTGWAVWVDEYYYIYPDATAIRNVSWKAGALGQPRQFQESLPLTNPGQTRGDVMEKDYLAVANLAGDVQRFEYVENPKKNAKEIPASPNIQQHNFKSPYDPFIIFEPGNKMQYISDRDIGLLDLPGSCNHWPVSQVYCDGRLAQATDRPSHFLGFPISDPVIHRKGDRNHLNSIYGMKDVSIDRLVEIGRSWADAPDLKISTDSDFAEGGYDMGQKAYLIDGNSAGADDGLEFEIEASSESPAINPAIVVAGWDAGDRDVVVDGRKLKEGDDYNIGRLSELDGVKTILWLKVEKREPFSVRLDW